MSVGMNVAAIAAALLSRGAAIDRSHGLQPVCECVDANNSPPLRGGVDATLKRREATFDGADGVVIHHKHILELIHHPVCATKVASQHLLDRADTPPRRGGEFFAS